MKNLHSHDIESLVFMNLDSILKEFYIRFVWGLFYEFDDIWEEIYDLLICNFMYICSVSQNIRNSCVKILYSHAIESLVFMTLDSILKEFYIRFVWGIWYEFDVIFKSICMLYMTTVCHVTLWTIYSSFHVSNLS